MTKLTETKRIADAAMFAAGAVSYTGLELLWRGHTHWTMTVTGGLCTLLVHLANRRMRNSAVFTRCVAGSTIITAVELAVGCVVNRLLGWNVWDYSSVPFNLMGQVCALYSAFWLLLCLPILTLSSRIDRSLAAKHLRFVR